MNSATAKTGLQLRSLVKKSGELELSLVSVPMPVPHDDPKSPWQSIRAFLFSRRARMYLQGHRHGSESVPIYAAAFEGNPLYVGVAPSLCMNGKARREGSLRGFNLIHLNRVGGVVVDYRCESYDIRGKTIERSKVVFEHKLKG